MILRSPCERPPQQRLMLRRRPPIGVILAGGLGRRIGGSKAIVQLAGTAADLLSARAVRTALSDVASIAKADTQLPACRRDGLDRARCAPPPAGGHHPGAGAGRGAPGRGLRRRPAVRHARADLPPRHSGSRRSPAVVACRGDGRPAAAGLLSRRARSIRCAAGCRPTAPVREWSRRCDPRCSRSATPSCCSTSTRPRICCRPPAILDAPRPGEPAAR